ncbi:DedA family protein [Microbacterium esteraromaticum]|uniref:DedA family protein n=1 Tax=Microbacterium esteraromaticum TaxID=57043 RepID=UPI001D5CB527|nr:membrane protein DedA with SNARE-associated domain [Microbacterium esteraromaticum]
MTSDALLEMLTGPWGLAAMALLVLGDAFLVVVPGEIAVTAMGAAAAVHGSAPLGAVIVVASAAAWCGDACCYLIGRLVGTDRWPWMRTARVQTAFAWARRRLRQGTATVLFTARFVPFARLAVNVVAGASGVRPGRYLCLAAIAATGWAVYQAVVGAIVASIVPGGPVPAIVVSVAVAVGLGMLVDAVTTRRSRSSRSVRRSG